ncbi:MAG: hypothetical protein KAJ72_07630 [Candidatus Heimdallarchaeota archaeon]|nr:hypothetical protein [Candidatus Heimdallarchaeota archaeon]
MSKFQVYSTEDLIILESKKQTIAAIGFSLSKQENKPFANLSDSIVNYLNSFGYSYVIRISKSYTRFFLLIVAKNPGDVINKVSKILAKMKKLKLSAEQLIISPLNHSIIMRNFYFNLQSSIKRTKNPRVLSVDDKYWLIYSLVIGKQERNYFTKFLKSLLSLKASTLNLSVKNVSRKRNGDLEQTNGILITHCFDSIGECENFLDRMKQISAQYNERFSCTLRFHTAYEVKQNIFSYSLGLSSVNQPAHNWQDVLKLDRFVPVLTNYSRELIDSAEQEIHQKLITIETGSNKISSKGSTIETKKSNKIHIKESSMKMQDSLIPYGKKVSEEEIEDLVETIPAPPSH